MSNRACSRGLWPAFVSNELTRAKARDYMPDSEIRQSFTRSQRPPPDADTHFGALTIRTFAISNPFPISPYKSPLRRKRACLEQLPEITTHARRHRVAFAAGKRSSQVR